MFATWLLEHDYDIRLLLGDADTIVIEEFRSVLQAQLGSYDEERIIEQPIASVEDVICRTRRDRRRRRNPLSQCSLGLAPQQARHRDFVSSQMPLLDARR